MENDLLVVTDLKKYYPVRKGLLRNASGHVKAVDGVSLAVANRQTLGLVGESGCGKSTVGKAILRLVEPTSGKIEFDGRDLLALNRRQLNRIRPEMQIVFQNPYAALNPRLSIGAAIGEPLSVHWDRVKNLGIRGGDTAEPESKKTQRPETSSPNTPAAKRLWVRERTVALLEVVGLPADAANRYPHEFSGGQRQRAVIARALALRPKLIVCDEAVSSLDVSIQAQMLNLLVDLQRDFGLSYLFISHDLSVVKHLSDRVAVMYLGVVVEEGSNEAIFSRPLHPYTQALLSSIPSSKGPGAKPLARLTGEIPSPAAIPSGCRFRTRCPVAVEECAMVKPDLKPAGGDHQVACLLAGQDGPEPSSGSDWRADVQQASHDS